MSPLLIRLRMACTAKCDSCKSCCVRPADSFSCGRRRSTSPKLTVDSLSVVIGSVPRPVFTYTDSPRSHDLTAGRSLGCRAAANRERPDNAPSQRAIVRSRRSGRTTSPRTHDQLRSREIKRDRRGSAAGRSCDGLPNACQTAHNEERLAKNGGARWWRVGRDTRSAATRSNHESHLFCYY